MNKIIVIILAIVLSLPVFVWAEDDIATLDKPAIENNLDEDIINEQETSSPFKEPISKRKLAKKFLAAMGAVVASSLVLYVGLSAYNKLRDNSFPQNVAKDSKSSLDTPENLSDAVKSFLDKTDWS